MVNYVNHMSPTMDPTCSLRLARAVLESVPAVMRRIRSEMREAAGPSLSVPQFRVLAYLSRHEGASACELARHQGVSDPAMSRTTETLRRHGLVQRAGDNDDHRRGHLSLSQAGIRVFGRTRARAAAHLSKSLARLAPEDARAIERALGKLEEVL